MILNFFFKNTVSFTRYFKKLIFIVFFVNTNIIIFTVKNFICYHGHKRATEQDRHPNAATATAQQEEEEVEDGGEEKSNKRPRLEEGAVAEEKTKVAEEDEDSEPSSDKEGDD